jgi:hypothetical protein
MADSDSAPRLRWLSPEVVLVATLMGGATALFVALARAGWPGAPSRCLRDFVCYCEVTSWGPLARQPYNAWSSLSCAPVALVVAADAAELRRESRRGAAAVGVLYAIAVALEGIGSLYFHGSLTTWGAVLDATGMAAVMSLVLLVTLFRGGVVAFRGVLAGWPILVALSLGYRAFVPVMAPLFLLLLIGIMLCEWHARQVATASPELRRWFARTLALFGAGVVAWVLSVRPGFPLCTGRLTQGHALWHLLTALAAGGCWRIARSALV